MPQILDIIHVNGTEVLHVRRQHSRKEDSLVAQVLHDHVGDRDSFSTGVEFGKMVAVEFGHRGLARTRSGAKFGLRLNCFDAGRSRFVVSVLGEEALNRLGEVPLAADGVGSSMSMGSLNICFEVSCASRVERSREDSATWIISMARRLCNLGNFVKCDILV